jgi:serine/threonine-protein kinase
LVLPPTPRPGASRDEWRHWKDEAKRTARWQREEFRAARRYARTEQRPERTVDERIRRFRSRAVGYGSTVSILAAINAATSPHFAWFIFPALGMGIPLLGQLGNLWADRVPLSRIFGRALPDESGTASAPSRATADALAKLAPRDVLEGPHGDAIRRAADDRAAILDTVAKLSKEDRALIPDVAPTATALVERVARLAETVHRLDASLPAETVAGLEARIAAAEREPETVPDRERRLGLLRRQRATLHDLTQRRAMLAGQMESAALALQSLRLDLARLRSAGIQSVLGDVTNATQEARALSREIGHALGAVEEAKKL